MRKNIIFCEVTCSQCGSLASKSGYYSPQLIKALKEETKDWIDDKEYGILCPECQKEFKVL